MDTGVGVGFGVDTGVGPGPGMGIGVGAGSRDGYRGGSAVSELGYQRPRLQFQIWSTNILECSFRIGVSTTLECSFRIGVPTPQSVVSELEYQHPGV